MFGAVQALASEIMSHETGHVAFMQNKVNSLGGLVPDRPAVRKPSPKILRPTLIH